MYPMRSFFGWRMLAIAQTQDERDNLRVMRTIFRAKFEPLMDLSETEFRNRYRLSKVAFMYLCEELRNYTELRSTQRINLETKVLTALFFYATGSYQRPVGVAKHLSQKTCSVYISEVTHALTHTKMLKKYIVFPHTPTMRKAVSHKFYMKYGIPGVLGCIDGSHFRIFGPPAEEEHLYYCRKHYHSINVQMVCDSEYRILNVNPRFGGAAHDAFIWENSNVNSYMQALHQQAQVFWLLGDSGYPQRPWLMTPILDAVAESPQSLYNEKHSTARVVIENVFGRLKNRWRCLNKVRVLHYKPKKCAQIIQACCVLYNIALDFKVPEPDGLDQGIDEMQPVNLHCEMGNATSDLIRGRVYRDHLVRQLQT